jgi:hypothetical protein
MNLVRLKGLRLFQRGAAEGILRSSAPHGGVGYWLTMATGLACNGDFG